MRKNKPAVNPPKSEQDARLARGECPVHGEMMAQVGHGSGGHAVFQCPVRRCEISALQLKARGAAFELLAKAKSGRT